MTTFNFEYNHPAYLVPYIFAGASTVGASGVTTKWAAFTTMKIVSVTYAANTVGTSSTTPLLFTKSGTATATSTLTAIGSAATTATNFALATPVALAQGDQFWVTHGTDATIVASVAVEARITPMSNITSVT